MEIVMGERGDADELAGVLATAFHEDALTRWIVPDDARRRAVLPGFFRVFVDLSLAHGTVFTTSAHDGVLLALPPGGTPLCARQEREIERRMRDLLGPDTERYLEIAALQGERHPAEPHWYISFCGVARERRGVGRALATAFLTRCAGPMYVEASSAGGLTGAHLMGFRPRGNPIVVPGGPELVPLWRQP
jgi:hypothetical protein